MACRTPALTIEQVVAQAQAKSQRPLAVVVNTGDANSYGIMVNLGRAGVAVISVASDPDNFTFKSRYVTPLLSPDFAVEEAAFIATLVKLGQQLASKPVLLVNGDEPMMVLLRHRAELEPFYLIPLPSYESAEALTNKTAFYPLLESLEAPHPHTLSPTTLEEVEAVAPTLDYPYIVKPSQSQTFSTLFGNKCLAVHSAAELIETYLRVRDTEPAVILQKQILGTERYLVYAYFNAQSRPLGLNSYRKVRILPTDFGNACVCETVVDAELTEMYLDLMRRLGYHGLAEAEIQRDARDGQLKFVEINARATTQTRLSAYCGVNMEYIAYQDALGLQPAPIENQQTGVRWVDLYRDLFAVFGRAGYYAQGRLSLWQWLRSLWGRRVFAYFSWEDPGPALHLFARHLRVHLFRGKRLAELLRPGNARSAAREHRPSDDHKSGPG
ncbi:MAG: ATP-grasp domain-containing protein [Halioglobus sp.]|nr:ATP-grasp domain-containing protein [Halioglobus sp.]